MRTALALIIAGIGIILSAYFGLVVMFVGGIEQIIDEINAETADGGQIAWGILRIVFASASFGFGTFFSLSLAGLVGRKR